MEPARHQVSSELPLNVHPAYIVCDGLDGLFVAREPLAIRVDVLVGYARVLKVGADNPVGVGVEAVLYGIPDICR